MIATDKDVAALGRFIYTLDLQDIGQFKTPSLHNVAREGPYIHDGSVRTLLEAIDLELGREISQLEDELTYTRHGSVTFESEAWVCIASIDAATPVAGGLSAC